MPPLPPRKRFLRFRFDTLARHVHESRVEYSHTHRIHRKPVSNTIYQAYVNDASVIRHTGEALGLRSRQLSSARKQILLLLGITRPKP